MNAALNNSKDLSFAAVLPKSKNLFYGGQWHAPKSGRFAETYNPANGEAIGETAQATASDVAAAVDAASLAFKSWRKTKPLERAELLRKAAAILRDNAEELAMLDALNTGNPVAEMVADAKIAAANLDYFAGIATEAKGQTLPMGDNNLNYTVREPLGVVVRVVAYNHPLMFAAQKLGAPLAAGNTVIIKPSEQAPLSAIRMAELIGGVFPPGVVNVLTGARECGEALTAHLLVKKITLIGSTATGKAILRGGADSLKQVLLELGGKNPLIAYPDSDLETLANGIVRGMNFTWAGQSCGSTSRVFLHDDIHDMVLERVVQILSTRHKPGIPTDWATTMGPVISKAHHERVMNYIETSKREGARLVTGGKRPSDPALANGYFIEPTIFADMRPDMTIAQEEIFGPVMAVFRWRDEDEMFDIVNSVEYGLTASIWTNNLRTAHRAASRVESGYVWINNVSQHFLGAPFGGYKSSGIGREESIEELLEFTQIKNVNINLG
jgi:betaine-aldehyde dehydrogenase